MKVYAFTYNQKQISDIFLSKEAAMKNIKNVWKKFFLECLEEWKPHTYFNDAAISLPCTSSDYVYLIELEVDPSMFNISNNEKTDNDFISENNN